ncbi:MAG: hypothetical protein J5817_02700 [Treponema sp.]|nr:hypothetical protein [Treponema sp.]
MGSLSAQEVSFGGSLKTKYAVGLPAKDSDKDEDNRGKFIEGKTTFSADLDVSKDDSSLRLEADFTYDPLKAISKSYDFVSGEQNFGIKLKEAYFDYNGTWWSMRLGRQISSWGKADGLTVCDILCPKDLSALLSEEYADSRLGIDAARLSLNWNWGTADAYFIPIFTPAALPLQDGNPLKEILIPPTVQDFSDSDIELPERKIANSEYGAKVSAYLPFADFSLYGFYGWDDEPLLEYSAEFSGGGIDGIGLSARYERMAMLGADAAIPLGETVIRLEGAFFPKRYFSTSAEKQIEAQAVNQARLAAGLEEEQVVTSVRKNQITALAGIDWMPYGWTFTAQYYADYVFDGTEEIERDQYIHLASLSIEKGILNETLTLSLSGLVEFNDWSWLIEPKAEYAVSDQISLSLGMNYFVPGPKEDKVGTYGKYKSLSCLTLGGKFSF